MEFTGSAGAVAAVDDDISGVEPEVALRVLRIDVGELSISDLDDRVEELGRARSQVEGQLAEALAERARRSSPRTAAGVLRERVLESAGRASGDVRLAVSLSENFPTTLEALAAGEITSGHARVIDRVAGKPDYRSEETILKDAKAVPADLLSRYALRRERAEVRDYTKYQQQRQDRKASITQEPDGSWKLFAHLDYMAGRRVSLSWAKMAEAFRREEKPESEITYQQRNADALVQLITRDGPQRATPASLLIISEYDAATGKLGRPRLDDGQPGRRRRRLHRVRRRRRPTAVAGPDPTLGIARPKNRARRPRRRLHRLQNPARAVRGPPHRALVGRRAHRLRQPRPAVPPTATTSSTTAIGRSAKNTEVATGSKPRPTPSPTPASPLNAWPNTTPCSATDSAAPIPLYAKSTRRVCNTSQADLRGKGRERALSQHF